MSVQSFGRASRASSSPVGAADEPFKRINGRAPRVAFVLEQHMGHRTVADNLRSALRDSPDVETHWIAVRYERTSAWWERVPFERFRHVWRGRSEVRRGLADLDVDVCIFNTQVPAMFGGGRARRLPHVLCMDDTPLLWDSVADSYKHKVDTGIFGWVKHQYNSRALKNASALAPYTEWVRASLIDDYGIDPARMEVIPFSVDLEAWQPADHTNEGPMKILFVGYDFERKGGESLLKAFDTLPPGSAELRIVTHASVPTRAGVEVHAGLTANEPRLRELFRTSDVFVLPSKFEMAGNSSVEAAASGLPTIVTAVGGMSDVVVDGVTGYLITPGDVEALAAHLRTLVEQPELRRTMGAAARKRAETMFDAHTNARRLVALALRAAGVA